MHLKIKYSLGRSVCQLWAVEMIFTPFFSCLWITAENTLLCDWLMVNLILTRHWSCCCGEAKPCRGHLKSVLNPLGSSDHSRKGETRARGSELPEGLRVKEREGVSLCSVFKSFSFEMLGSKQTNFIIS